MTHVFVSYARIDHSLALPIIQAISDAGLKVWHPGAISPENTSVEQVRREIETAQCVVVLWSEAAAQSRFVQQAMQAWSSDRLVLAALDNTPLPVGLRDLAVISIPGASDSGTKQLIERAQAIVGQRAISGAPPSSGPTPAHHPARSAGPRRSGPIVTAALIAGIVVLMGVRIETTLHAPQSTSRMAEALPLARLPPVPTAPSVRLPPANESIPTGSPLLSILVVLILGAAIGAGAVWVWTARSHRRSNLPPAAALSRQTPAASNVAPQVFVSYSRQDGRTVEQLVQQIEQLGYAVWIDRLSTGSQRYAAPIVHAIRKSRLVALMCSQNAFASDHVIREVYVAGDYKKPFIAFELDSTGFPDEVLYFLSGFPRVPIATIDPQRLRSEIARLVVA